MKKFFPILDWLPNYQKSNLKGDLSAGLTVGIMLIPQGMAYAMIAGLPPQYGLYAAMLPQVIYAIFGTSRQLAVGPVAMDSLLVATAISGMAVLGSENYIALALLLAFMMGSIQLIFGLARLGFLVNFLSKPVINGFTSAAAIVIGLNQVKYVLGTKVDGGNSTFDLIASILKTMGETNFYTLALAIASFVIIKYAKKIHPMLPGALIAVVFGIIAVVLLKLDGFGVQIVKDIPSGFPSFQLHNFDWETIKELFPIAVTLSLIAFMEAISVAKAIQLKHREEYQLDSNQELIGLGMANIVSSFVGSYPVTGGFSRSAVNEQAGANTNLAAIISASLIALVLLFFTQWFYFLPHAVLGSIILVAVLGLIDIKFPVFLWKTHKQDFYMLVATFVVTLSFGIKEGIITGVLISLAFLIYRTTKPHVAVLGKLPNTIEYRNIKRFKEIETRKDVLVLRYDAQLYFANSTHFIDSVLEHLNQNAETKLLVLDFGSVSHIDSSALQSLFELVEDLGKKGVKVYFSSIIGPVRDFLTRAKFVKSMGVDKFFIDIQSAINAFDSARIDQKVTPMDAAIQANVFGEREV